MPKIPSDDVPVPVPSAPVYGSDVPKLVKVPPKLPKFWTQQQLVVGLHIVFDGQAVRPIVENGLQAASPNVPSGHPEDYRLIE